MASKRAPKLRELTQRHVGSSADVNQFSKSHASHFQSKAGNFSRSQQLPSNTSGDIRASRPKIRRGSTGSSGQSSFVQSESSIISNGFFHDSRQNSLQDIEQSEEVSQSIDMEEEAESEEDTGVVSYQRHNGASTSLNPAPSNTRSRLGEHDRSPSPISKSHPDEKYVSKRTPAPHISTGKVASASTGRIQASHNTSGRIQQSLNASGRIQQSLTTSGRIQPSLNTSGRIQTSLNSSGRIHTSSPSKRRGKETCNEDRFPRIELLGKGASGKVYLCREQETNEIYAMKVFGKGTTIRQDRVANVMAEREILASLDHPFVASLKCAYEDAASLYLILEFCAGGELFTILKRQEGTALSEQDARFYAAEILVGLEYLHASGVCYRDLKGENILLSPHGHVRLTDFDLSTLHKGVGPRIARGQPITPGHNSWSTRVRQSIRKMVGTLEYVAPEVMQHKAHDDMADWWSYGILLYEMLLGRNPYSRMTRPQVAEAAKKGVIKIPKEKISDSAYALLKGLLHPNPTKRIGHKHGAAEIKAHPWFQGLDFNTLRHQTPPIVPQLSNKVTTDLDFHPEIFLNCWTRTLSTYSSKRDFQSLIVSRVQF